MKTYSKLDRATYKERWQADTCNIRLDDIPFTGNLQMDLYYEYISFMYDIKAFNYSGNCDG
jgi:hypothetical protein